MKRNYWLMKSEPYAFSIDDLRNAENQTTSWDGVRNYEARNIMRDEMKKGDGVLFYHSNIKPPEIVGTMVVSSDPHPDKSQFDPDSDYFDPTSPGDNPRWILVDVTFNQKFDKPVTRNQVKQDPVLKNMVLLKRFRLSITPVTEKEWNRIHELAGAGLST